MTDQRFPPNSVTIWIEGVSLWLSWHPQDVTIEGRLYHVPGGTVQLPADESGPPFLLRIMRTLQQRWAPGNEASLIEFAQSAEKKK